jgi:hypothetical protein
VNRARLTPESGDERPHRARQVQAGCRLYQTESSACSDDENRVAGHAQPDFHFRAYWPELDSVAQFPD